MNPDEYPKVIAHGNGYVSIYWSANSFTCVTEDRAKELLDPDGAHGDSPAVIVRDPNKHDETRHKRLYGVNGGYAVNEDLQHPLAAREYPHYSREGPQKGPVFATMTQKRRYMKRYHFEEV